MSTTNDRLGFAVMGLGLMRLLQDTKRYEEACQVLHALEGSKGVAEKPAKATPAPRRIKPIKVRVFAA